MYIINNGVCIIISVIAIKPVDKVYGVWGHYNVLLNSAYAATLYPNTSTIYTLLTPVFIGRIVCIILREASETHNCTMHIVCYNMLH